MLLVEVSNAHTIAKVSYPGPYSTKYITLSVQHPKAHKSFPRFSSLIVNHLHSAPSNSLGGEPQSQPHTFLQKILLHLSILNKQMEGKKEPRGFKLPNKILMSSRTATSWL